MVKRRAVFKHKVKLPEGTESENEVKLDYADASDSNFDGSSSSDEGHSDAELRRKMALAREAGSSSSSDSDSSDEETKRQTRKVEVSGGSSSSSEDSSASDSGGSESEDEKSRKEEEKKKSSGSFKRLKKISFSSSSSSDEDSELEEVQPQDTKESVKVEEYDSSKEELDNEEMSGSDTDSELDWQAKAKLKAEEKKATTDKVVEESDRESGTELHEDEWEDMDDEPTEEENEDVFSNGVVKQAKFVLRNITSRVPLIEETAIRRGVKLSGPPIEFATTHLDEYARKFRWPQHVRNLRNTNFSQDPSEILEDYEVELDDQQPEPILDESERDESKESAFAQVPRPIVALAAESLRRSSRKRKRDSASQIHEDRAPSATALLNIARVGGQFGDNFVESLLSANGRALQGVDSGFDYDKRCWSSLPTKKKPIANWRFVFEHVRRTMGRSESPDDTVFPPLKQETLDRITNRLKKLYGSTTQHEEYDVFNSTSTAPSLRDGA